jgi:hypothetical protein
MTTTAAAAAITSVSNSSTDTQKNNVRRNLQTHAHEGVYLSLSAAMSLPLALHALREDSGGGREGGGEEEGEEGRACRRKVLRSSPNFIKSPGGKIGWRRWGRL